MASEDLFYRYILDVVDNATRPMLQGSRQQQKAIDATRRALRGSDDQAKKSSKAQVDAAAKSAKGFQLSADYAVRAGARTAGASRQVARAADLQARSVVAAGRASRRLGQDVGVGARASRLAAAAGDRLAASYLQVSRRAREAAVEQRKQNSATQKAARSAGQGISAGGAAATGAVAAGAAAAGIGGAGAVSQVVGFDKAMATVNAKLLTNQANMAKLTDLAIELGAKTTFSAGEAAGAMTELAAAGFTTEQILKVLPGTLSLAAASGTDLASSASLQTSVLAGFGLAAKDAAHVADVLALTTNKTATDMSDLAETLPYVASTARQTGTSFEEVAAAAGVLGNAGIKGSMAGTALRTSMLRLTDPTKKMRGVLGDMGIEASSLAAIPLPEVIGRVADGLKNLPTRGEKVGAISAIFGKEAAPSVLNLMAQGREGLDRLSASLVNADGAAKQSEDILLNTASASWDEFTGSIESASIMLLSRFKPVVQDVLGSASDRVGKLAKGGSDFVDALTGGGSSRAPRRAPARTEGMGNRVAAPQASGAEQAGRKVRDTIASIAPVAMSVGGQLIDAFRPAEPFLRNVLIPLLKGVAQGVLGSVVTAFKIAVPVIRTVATVLGFVGRALAPLSPAFRGVGVVIGFVATGPILKAVGGAIRLAGAFGRLGAPIRLAGTALRGVGSVMTGVSRVGSRLVSGVGAVAGGVGRMASRVVNAMARINPAVVAVRLIISRLPNAIASIATRAASAAQRVAQGIANGFNGVRRIPSRIATWVGGIPGRLGSLVAGMLSAGRTLGKGIVDGVLAAIRSAPGAIADAVEGLIPGPVKDVLGGVGGAIGGLFSGRNGGRVERFAAGGIVPSLVSSGEKVVYGNRTWTVPGTPVARDNVFAGLPAGAAVLTFDGQARMAAGASLEQALTMQAPHFRTGGQVVKGRASVFGPPLEKRGITASGVTSQSQGVAIRPGDSFQSGRKYMGGFWDISLAGRRGTLKQIDLGPHERTGRRVDITGAGARKLGFDPARFPTDRIATARFLGDTRSAKRSGARGGSGAASDSASVRGALTYGERVSDALQQGLQQGMAGAQRVGGGLLSAIAKSALGEPDTGVSGPSAASASPSLSTGPAAGGASRMSRMLSKARSIEAAGYQYAWAGGHRRLGQPNMGSLHAHGRGPIGLGYDCSGAVSAVLGAGGLLKAPLNSTGLMGWGKAGAGRNLAVVADPGHTIMRLGNRWFGTGRGNPKGGAGWLNGNTMSGRGVTRTWPGFRAGGVVPRVIGQSAQPTTSVVGSRRVQLPRNAGELADPGGSLRTILRTPAAVSIAAPMRVLAAQLANAERVSYDRILQLARALSAGIARAKAAGRGDSKLSKRYQAVLDLIDAEVGRRAGLAMQRAQMFTDEVARTNSNLDAVRRLTGVDAASSQGIRMAMEATRASRGPLEQAERVLSGQVARLGRKAPQELKDKLAEVRDQLTETILSYAEQAREFVKAQAQERIDTAQFYLDAWSADTQILEAQQRVAGVHDTPAAMLERANRLQASVAPLLQLQGAQWLQSQDLAALGDAAGSAQAWLSAHRTAAEVWTAQADAAELFREAAEKQAQAAIDAANAAKEALLTAAQASADTAAFNADVGDLQYQGLELRQRLAGTYESAGAAQERQSYIRNVLIPLVQGEIGALTAQLDTIRQAEGEASEAYRSKHLELLSKQNGLTQAEINATEAVGSKVDELKDVTGTLSFESSGQRTTDLLHYGTGA